MCLIVLSIKPNKSYKLVLSSNRDEFYDRPTENMHWWQTNPKVLAGKDKAKEGEVIEIDRKTFRAKVKEINMVKKHVKTTKEKKGGIFSKESFIHMSNLKLVTEKNKKKKTEVKK